MCHISFLQIRCDFGELGKGGLEVFYYLLRDDVWWRKVRAVFERFVFEPEDELAGKRARQTGRQRG